MHTQRNKAHTRSQRAADTPHQQPAAHTLIMYWQSTAQQRQRLQRRPQQRQPYLQVPDGMYAEYKLQSAQTATVMPRVHVQGEPHVRKQTTCVWCHSVAPPCLIVTPNGIHHTVIGCAREHILKPAWTSASKHVHVDVITAADKQLLACCLQLAAQHASQTCFRSQKDKAYGLRVVTVHPVAHLSCV
jgi:hypothetical protein